MSLGQEDPLEEMANHSHVLAWKIPRTAESDRLQPTGLHRVRHDGAMEHACTLYICVCVCCVCVYLLNSTEIYYSLLKVQIGICTCQFN